MSGTLRPDWERSGQGRVANTPAVADNASSGAQPEPADPAWRRVLLDHGLIAASEPARWTMLAGGVSSDIWRADTPTRSFCVKRALPRLKVADDWQAPTSRNACEWEWIRFAARHVPRGVPRLLARDAQAGLFAMEFLEPADYPVWKQQLLDGQADPQTARAVGELIARVHEASAGQMQVARDFATLANFQALRLEPYLLATARKRPALAQVLHELAQRTGQTQRVLVHGDVSPKNILVGRGGPVLLDAECAWYGDPAFDIAFCLNHLLLKCLVQPSHTDDYLRCFTAFVDAYFSIASFEPRPGLEARAAALLPALLLARVDGKSPVEYLHDETGREAVRRFACPLIVSPPLELGEIAGKWKLARSTRA